jgi:hypothetical protein
MFEGNELNSFPYGDLILRTDYWPLQQTLRLTCLGQILQLISLQHINC